MDSSELADTVVMKTLKDMRKLLARENAESLPIQTDVSMSVGDLEL